VHARSKTAEDKRKNPPFIVFSTPRSHIVNRCLIDEIAEISSIGSIVREVDLYVLVINELLRAETSSNGRESLRTDGSEPSTVSGWLLHFV
jgi:hypothetical protein